MKFWWDSKKDRLILDMENTITFNKNYNAFFLDKSLEDNKIPFTLQNGYSFHVDDREWKIKSFYKCAKALWRFI